MAIKDQNYTKKLYWSFIILYFTLTVIMRLALLNRELPYHSLDENDVVEPALAFLSGDLEPGWYKYGPLYSYLLAFIYKIWMWTAAVTLGWSESDFFYAAFYEPTSFYVLARAFHSLIVIGIAGVSWLFARRYFDSRTSVAVLILGLAPFLGLNTDFTARIDTLQGLFSLSSLFFAAQFGKDGRSLRPYIISGFFAGLSIATKPLPGLMVLPALVFGHFLSAGPASNRSLKKKIQFAVTQPGLWILACSVILAHALANPYSVINFKDFLWEHYRVIFLGDGQGGALAGYDFSWLVSIWGWPMVIAMALALLTAWRRSDASRILLVYVVTFIGVFLAFKTRKYWYNSIFPAVILLVGVYVSNVSQSVAKYVFDLWKTDPRDENNMQVRQVAIMVVLAIVLALPPLWTTGLQAHDNWFSPGTSLEKRPDRAAQLWIESNLPDHSPILLVGWHASSLPRIVADTPDTEAVWGDYFDYGRDENLSWSNTFLNAYTRMQQTDRPVYDLANIQLHYSDDHPDPALNTLLREYLADFARLNDYRYIVTASPDKFKGTWEKGPRVKLLASFNGYARNKKKEIEVKIFKVLQYKFN
jgi:hypothetical protein